MSYPSSPKWVLKLLANLDVPDVASNKGNRSKIVLNELLFKSKRTSRESRAFLELRNSNVPSKFATWRVPNIQNVPKFSNFHRRVSTSSTRGFRRTFSLFTFDYHSDRAAPLEVKTFWQNHFCQTYPGHFFELISPIAAGHALSTTTWPAPRTVLGILVCQPS